MKIAIDYDRTYTLNPTVWSRFITERISDGDTIFIVTARDKDLDTIEEDLPRS